MRPFTGEESSLSPLIAPTGQSDANRRGSRRRHAAANRSRGVARRPRGRSHSVTAGSRGRGAGAGQRRTVRRTWRRRARPARPLRTTMRQADDPIPRPPSWQVVPRVVVAPPPPKIFVYPARFRYARHLSARRRRLSGNGSRHRQPPAGELGSHPGGGGGRRGAGQAAAGHVGSRSDREASRHCPEFGLPRARIG
jgi:hypothetical protein